MSPYYEKMIIKLLIPVWIRTLDSLFKYQLNLQPTEPFITMKITSHYIAHFSATMKQITTMFFPPSQFNFSTNLLEVHAIGNLAAHPNEISPFSLFKNALLHNVTNTIRKALKFSKNRDIKQVNSGSVFMNDDLISSLELNSPKYYRILFFQAPGYPL